MTDCEHSNLKVFGEEGEGGNYKTVYLCRKCGRFLVSIVGDAQFFDFEFSLLDLDQAIAAARHIFNRNSLQIVLASVDNVTIRDIVCRAFDEVIQSERHRRDQSSGEGARGR